MEGLKQLVDCTGGGHTLVELIGVREKEALKAAGIALFYAVKEGIVKGRIRRCVHKIVIVANALGIKLFKDIMHGVALGEGYLESDHCAGACLHLHDERTVIIAGLEFICARVKLCVGI